MKNDKDNVEAGNEVHTDEQTTTKKSVGRGVLVVIFVILGSLIWYLFADRHTPYTSQARLAGNVIGVAPKVAGLVTDVWVRNNELVRKGQKLFQIDSSAYRITFDRARSDLETAYRQASAGSASVEAARANLLAAKANEKKAEKDFDRLSRLYQEDPGTISVRRLEISQATLDQSRAAVTASEADIRRIIEQMGGTDIDDNALLKSAIAAVDQAARDLANSTVVAASNGVVTDLNADVGQYAGTGSAVLTLISANEVWIDAEFTENNLGNMSPGDAVEIHFDVLPGHVFDGVVGSIGMGVGDGRNTPPGTLPSIQNDRDWLRPSQRFPVTIEFDSAQAENLRDQLRIGGQASVVVYTQDDGLLRFLGGLHIRAISWLSYAY